MRLNDDPHSVIVADFSNVANDDVTERHDLLDVLDDLESYEVDKEL